MPTPRPAQLTHRLAPVALRMVLATVAVAVLCVHASAQRVMFATRTPPQITNAVDAGALPSSTPIQLTLTLAMSTQHTAALDDFLASVASSSSPGYHQWLTPQQFATRFGATDDQISAVTAWLTSQGLSVDAVSPAHTRLTISGTAAAVESAFALTLHQYRIDDSAYFASTTAASLPPQIAPLIESVSGLDNMPPNLAVTTISSNGVATRLTPAALTPLPPAPDQLPTIAAAIDANTTPVLLIDTSACFTDYAQSDYEAYRALFRQANAQGITILATSECISNGTTSFPASLAEATAVAWPNSTAPNSSAPDSSVSAGSSGIETRPAWQAAPGLPADSTRAEPDLTTNSITAFAQTLSTIVQQSGTRQGNINATLYALSTAPGLYRQPDPAAAGTWETATGLGQVDLAKLAQAWPRGTTASATAVSSSIYGATYGQAFILAATVGSSASAIIPTGTVTFSAAAQGILGTSTLSNGVAALNLPGSLPVGTYTISANYSGDATYAPSVSPANAIVTISQATGAIAASISPSTVNLGSSALLTVTVTLPYPGSAPAGNVTATVNGVAGAVYTTILAPVLNTASATATIAIPAPVNPGTYTVQITCAGSANFQCPTPGLVSLTSTGTGGGSPTGNTSTILTVSPSAPTAGQSVTLTAILNATVAGAPTGTVTFYNNGAGIATAPVSNKQASAIVILASGTGQTLTATYSGDATFNTSTSAATIVNVAAVASSMIFTQSAASTLRGANILFTAQITAGSPPTGTVTFFDTYNGSTSSIGTATLSSAGTTLSIAQLSTSALLSGAHQVYAAYLGDANSSAVTSSPVPVSISDYTVTPTPLNLTLTSGQIGIVNLAIGALGSFTGKVTFTCIAPANTETTCSITPGALTGAGNVTMTILTTAAHAESAPPAKPRSFTQAVSGTALAMLFYFCMPRRRRRLPSLLMAMLAFGIVVGFGLSLGCAGGTNVVPAGDPGTPAGTTLFSVDTAGTDGVTTVTHNLQYQVTLK